MKAVSIAVVFAVFGCVVVLNVSAVEASKYREKVLYSFCIEQNCKDGTRPGGGLVDLKGMLYGTTNFGGAYSQGTVFAVDRKTGSEIVVHSFCGTTCSDGTIATGNLIDVGGILYGTTEEGGDGCGGGIVFSLDPNSGAETVLHTFCGGSDGDGPLAGLTEVKGTLYGTTLDGGDPRCGCGTVFSVDAGTGEEAVLYSFRGGTDGQYPRSGLIQLNGKLYGTTDRGGFYNANAGTIFSIDLKTRKEKVLYSFCSQFGCPDGAGPDAALVAVNGILYGTTVAGGTGDCTFYTPPGCGTVFAFDPAAGVEKVLHSFTTGGDGQYPGGSLIPVGDKLYGTTIGGGRYSRTCTELEQCGTVFSLSLSTDAEKVLYSFCRQVGCADGDTPSGSLRDVKGTLYGTAGDGGANQAGVVFALKPRR